MKLKNLLPSFLIFCTSVIAEDSSFYKREPLFSKRPKADAEVSHLTRVGPIGISLDLLQPSFTMRIKAVESGSPAAAAGHVH